MPTPRPEMEVASVLVVMPDTKIWLAASSSLASGVPARARSESRRKPLPSSDQTRRMPSSALSALSRMRPAAGFPRACRTSVLSMP